MSKLEIDLSEINQLNDTDCSLNLSQEEYKNAFYDEFKEVFSTNAGCVPNLKIELKLKPNTKPIFKAARHVPYALQEQVTD